MSRVREEMLRGERKWSDVKGARRKHGGKGGKNMKAEWVAT